MKKIVSIILAVLLVSSLIASVSAYSAYPDAQTADEAIADYEATTGETVVTHKYLFQMPNGNNGPVASADVTYVAIDEETGEETETLVCKAGDHTPTWYHEGFTEGAAVYWWEGTAACGGWCGYKAMVEDADQCIYYANVPEDVVIFIWNNGIDGGERFVS